jgi:hypothetical protein
VREYGKVYTAFWTSEDARSMSEDGRMLALYLMTCPHGNMLGCFRLADAYAADDMQWPIERVQKGFDELFEKGFAYRCKRSQYVFIRYFLKWNLFENPNVGKAAGKMFQQLGAPDMVKSALAAALREFAPHFPSKILDAFESSTEPFENPFETNAETRARARASTRARTGAGSAAGAADGEPSATPPATRKDDDPVKLEVWRTAKALCDDAGLADSGARSAIGLLVKEFSVQLMLDVVRIADQQPKPLIDPVAFMRATGQRLTGERRPPNKQEALEQRNQQIADELRREMGIPAGGDA